MLDNMWRAFVAWFHKWGSPKWFYEMSQPWSFFMGWIGSILALIAVVWGIGFTAADSVQGDSYRIIYLHVPTAFLSQAIYIMIAMSAAVGLIWKMKVAFAFAKQAVAVGMSFAILAFVTGAIWGIPTWTFSLHWIYDARIFTVLVFIFLYMGIWTIPKVIENERTADQTAAVLSIIGVAIIPLIKLSVNMFFTLHQGQSIKITEESALDNEYIYPLLMSILGFYLFSIAMILMRTRTEVLVRNRKSSWVKELVISQGAKRGIS